ncbi:MAG: EamA family transporter [Idiomarina sp.]
MSNWGIILVAAAALCWGLSGGIAGVLIDNQWSSLTVSFYRGAIGLLFMLMWLMLSPRGNGFHNPWLWLWSIIAGIGVAGNFYFYFFSIAESSVAVAATLMYCAPIFVYLVSFVLNWEHSTLWKWLAILLVMIGVVLLTRIYQLDASNVTPLGVITGLLSAISLALFIFGFKYATLHGSAPAILTIAFTTLVLALGSMLNYQQAHQVLTSVDWPLFAALGVLGGGVSFAFYVVGLRQTPPAIASIVAMVEPVTAALFGVIILGELLVGIQLAGMALILVTVAALGVYSNQSE